MPSKPRPKTFVAVVDFSAAGETYAAGDVVSPGAGLRAALEHGDRFVTPKRKANQAETETNPPTDTQETPQ